MVVWLGLGGYGVEVVDSFCSRCGARLVDEPPTACTACGRGVFVDAAPSASVVIVDETGRFLAVRRAVEPGAGLWDLPGGFCDSDHPADAAVREAFEETGLDVVLGDLVGIYTDTYKFDGAARPTLNIYYLATAAPGQTLRPDPAEVQQVAWHSFDAPPPMAFAHQAAVLADAATAAAKATSA